MESLQGIEVLVVDDDEDALRLYVATLGRMGAAVRVASSAAGALSLLEGWRPDVMLCDLHLPGVDGYTLLAQVKERDDLRGVPVIAISGSDPSLERERCRSAGFHDHLLKPVRLDAVISAIRAAHRASAPPPPAPPAPPA